MSRRSVAFMSYAHIDNKYGQLTEFRERLAHEVLMQTGEEFRIFQDRDDILLGQNWRQRIQNALAEEITFLIPILTPSFFNSKACREELKLFIERERELDRNDLVLPVYYVNCRVLEDDGMRVRDELAEAISARQWVDWRGLRFEPFASAQVGKALMHIAGQICLAWEHVSAPAVKRRENSGEVTKRPHQKGDAAIKSPEGCEVFIAYSHKDRELRDQIIAHLGPLKRSGRITHWHNRVVASGEEWTGKIDKTLNQSAIILFLVSPAFLASDYCYGDEVKRAVERHEASEARVYPIILRPCDWGGTPFAKLQALPQGAVPITRWANRDAAMLDVASRVRKAIENHKSLLADD